MKYTDIVVRQPSTLPSVGKLVGSNFRCVAPEFRPTEVTVCQRSKGAVVIKPMRAIIPQVLTVLEFIHAAIWKQVLIDFNVNGASTPSIYRRFKMDVIGSRPRVIPPADCLYTSNIYPAFFTVFEQNRDFVRAQSKN